MDFALSDEQQAIFDMARGFGAEHIAPHARDWEARGTIPKDLWPKIAALGLGGIYVSEENGGAGLTRLDATLVFEALSMSCASVAAFLSIHNMCAKMIDSYGVARPPRPVPAQGADDGDGVLLLPDRTGLGLGRRGLRTRAERTNAGFALTGTKAFISGGGYSDAYIVMCRTGDDSPRGISAVIVEDGTPGLSFGGLEEQDGLAVAAHPPGPVRRLRDPGRQPPRRGRARLPLRHGGPRRRAAQHRGLLARRGAGGARRDARLHGRTQRVRAADRPVPGAPVPPRRHGDRACRPRAPSCGRRHGSSTRARPMRPSSARWPRSLSPKPARASPTSACSFTAATATSPTTGSRRSCATCASTRSSKARTRSCA